MITPDAEALTKCDVEGARVRKPKITHTANNRLVHVGRALLLPMIVQVCS